MREKAFFLRETGFMAELKNEFSWSKTRDEVFRTCPRQYWFHYYGHWNGWREDAPVRTREIYVLKNLKNRQVWAGEIVHECIERTLNNIRRGIKVLSVDEIVSMTLQRMRTDFRSSRSKHYLNFPKTCALFEHEYEISVTDEQWKDLARDVETCLRNFYASDIYDALKSHRKDGWLEVEEFSSFPLDETRVIVAIDCAIQEGDEVFIYDWKTGRSLHEDLSIQLGCYALYTTRKWDIPLDRIRIIEFNLLYNKASSFAATHEDVENITGYMRGSIKDMQSLLIDLRNNIPLDEEHFRKVEDERVSLRCNFRKVCRGEV
jgi:hypothetical protein